ncbi:MAG: ABC transporter ATP-binding protein [Bacteroidales bacterium]|nr:ABC transporter ATP-binding protein [Bacteroidales bacterium]
MNNLQIELKQVTAGYQGHTVLEDVSLSIRHQDFIGVIGPNGGGKTTLLRVLLGLIKPFSGTVHYHISRKEIGYLPQISQFDDQFPITVHEVVHSGLLTGIRSGVLKHRSCNARIEEILDSVGIRALQNRSIGELSGGELQRTMLARAIISSPRLLVLDEPNTYVDNKFEIELYAILKELNKTLSILLVSHDIGTISPYIKSIACVNRRLHYHPSNEISEEQLKVYNCPIEIISHGQIPHRIIKEHQQ